MHRRVRSLVLCVVAAAIALAGCGNKEDFVTLGETEGIYVTVDDLKYQVQISRILNPASPEDRAYLEGLPAGEAEPADDEVWFGIFMRVENETSEPRVAADHFEVVDTQDNRFEPLELDTEVNAFAYEPRELPGGTMLPVPDSPAYDNTIRGSLLLFKLRTESLYNRPLELEISSSQGEGEAVIDLDV